MDIVIKSFKNKKKNLENVQIWTGFSIGRHPFVIIDNHIDNFVEINVRSKICWNLHFSIVNWYAVGANIQRHPLLSMVTNFIKISHNISKCLTKMIVCPQAWIILLIMLMENYLAIPVVKNRKHKMPPKINNTALKE